MFSFLFLYFNIFRLAVVVFFLGIFFLFKETTLVKCWLIDINMQNRIINEKLQEKYSNICIITAFFKFFCFIYFIYFIIFRLDFGFLLPVDLSVEAMKTTLDNFIKLLEPLYFILLLFINAVFIDFFLELVIMFSDADLVLTTYSNLARKFSKTALIAIGGGSVAGAILSVSPLVELPGVNESQIYFGRGYGYKTSLDWLKGTIINSYIDKSTVTDLAKKYGGANKVLDSNSFDQMLQNESKVTNHLNKHSTFYEQRLLGLRRF